MDTTYLFYDIETTGLSKCFDQILQFAAIRTDLNLNEISQHDIQIKLNPDVIPSPAAILTHRISITEMQQGEPEIEAIKKIHHLMNTPGTISVGYNTLGFDDEFLRFSFYRHLLTPYTHQYKNQCGRMDLYPITALYYLLKPDIIEWPTQNNKISLKLENLSRANGLTTEGRAHHALTDVKACIALAKKLMTAPQVWQQAILHFDRTAAPARNKYLTPAFDTTFNCHREAIAVQGGFGAELNYQVPVIELGTHHHYTNQSLWLRLDQENLSTITEENISTLPFILRQRNAEPPILLSKNHHQLSATRAAITEENKMWLQKNPHLFQKICAYYQNYTYPKAPHIDAAAALYEIGFPTPQEVFLFQRFHLATPAEKEKIAMHFPHPIYKKLALRLLGRYQFSALSEPNQQEYQAYYQTLLQTQGISTDHRQQPRLTVPAALAQLADIPTETLDLSQQHLLIELKNYLQAMLQT